MILMMQTNNNELTVHVKMDWSFTVYK